MKAKEEYIDAPRETRSKDITVYAIIFLVLLVGAGIFLAVRLLHKPADAALASSKSGIVYDSSAVEGGWDNLSPEEIAEKLNEKVADVGHPLPGEVTRKDGTFNAKGFDAQHLLRDGNHACLDQTAGIDVGVSGNVFAEIERLSFSEHGFPAAGNGAVRG